MFRTFEFFSLDIVSNFVLRISKLSFDFAQDGKPVEPFLILCLEFVTLKTRKRLNSVVDFSNLLLGQNTKKFLLSFSGKQDIELY